MGKQTAVEFLTWKQIRQGANDFFSQRQACQEAVLEYGTEKNLCDRYLRTGCQKSGGGWSFQQQEQ